MTRAIPGDENYPTPKRDGRTYSVDPFLEEHRDLLRRLAFGLDAALPHLARDAQRERRDEEGKALRSVTKQQRYDMAAEAVGEAFALLGLER